MIGLLIIISGLSLLTATVVIFVCYRRYREYNRFQETADESLSLLTATLESTADGILVVDNAGKVRSANQRFLEMWRIPVPLMATGEDKRLLDFVLDQLKDPEGFLKKVQYLYDRPDEESFDTLEFKDGRIFERYSLPQRIGDGIVGRVWSFRDVTERKRAEKALVESEKKYRNLVDTMNEGLGVQDENGAITFVNRQMAEMLGYQPEELIGKPTEFVFDEENRKILRENMEKRRKGGTDRYEIVYTRKDGSKMDTMMSPTPLFDGDGNFKGAVAVFTDISALKRFERDLREKSEELERSNKNLKDFSGIVSHDLQEPLRTIEGFASRLEQMTETKIDETERDYLARIRKNVRRMSELIDDLLVLTRVSARELKSETVDLASAVQEALIGLDRLVVQSGGRIEVGPLPKVTADRIQMTQLFQNLISNALKFRNVDRSPVVKIEAEGSKEGGVRITVCDNGIGFEQEFADQIFEPFRRLHGRQTYPGSGLGLSVCRKIVERHGGHIEATGVPGQGATFTITLPKEAQTS